MGVFWNRHDLPFMMGAEIFKIDASWAKKLTKTRVQFLLTPTVVLVHHYYIAKASPVKATNIFICQQYVDCTIFYVDDL